MLSLIFDVGSFFAYFGYNSRLVDAHYVCFSHNGHNQLQFTDTTEINTQIQDDVLDVRLKTQKYYCDLLQTDGIGL